MGLAIRKDKHGKRYPTWFGEFRDLNGKRVCVDLEVAIEGTPPVPFSLKDEGDAAFEVSRQTAAKELKKKKDDARHKGVDIHRVAKLIELKTGSAVEYARVNDLPALWRAIDREEGQPAESYLKWCDSVFSRFAAAVPCDYLYEVKPEHISAFLAGMRKNRTHKTVKDMTTLVRAAFNRLLPVGVQNPFGKTIRRKKAGNAIEGGAVARRPLTGEQLETLFETARPDPFLYPLTVCAACTGMRIGDVCCLRWQSVDLRAGWVRVATSKTGAEVEIPIFDRLRKVFEAALADRTKSPYVWPKAAAMYEGETANKNPTRMGIYYRGKALFARAFAPVQKNALKKTAEAPARADLSVELAQVSETVKERFCGAKRDRILDTLTRYANGQSYRQIEAETGRQRGQTSEDLRDAERASDVILRKGASVKSKRDLKTLIENTREKRDRGCHAASVWGWHNLRGTFVTVALNAGLPFETVAKCTGHTTAKTIRDHYYNPTREHTRKAMQQVDELIGGKPAAALNEHKTDRVTEIAAYFNGLTKTERTQLAKMLQGAENRDGGAVI